jgi:uncharacterized lipoprotein YmbA
MKRLLVIAALALAACAPIEETPQATSETTAAPATKAAPATTAKPTPTTLSERQRHWQEVVKTMSCAELADLEQKRLAIQFNDQAESLAAIHDRQAKLDCPQ